MKIVNTRQNSEGRRQKESEFSVIQEILAVYQEATISFPWQQGDVLMLDNMLTAHGRNPYVGSRKIVVAMGEIIRSEDIDRKGMQAANVQSTS